MASAAEAERVLDQTAQSGSRGTEFRVPDRQHGAGSYEPGLWPFVDRDGRALVMFAVVPIMLVGNDVRTPASPLRRVGKATGPADRRDYVSMAEAATILGVSYKTIQRAIRGIGRPLPHHRIGRRVVLARADLDRWITAQRDVPEAAPTTSTDAGILLQRLAGADMRERRRR